MKRCPANNRIADMVSYSHLMDEDGAVEIGIEIV